jgi:hypothetical protein
VRYNALMVPLPKLNKDVSTGVGFGVTVDGKFKPYSLDYFLGQSNVGAMTMECSGVAIPAVSKRYQSPVFHLKKYLHT